MQIIRQIDKTSSGIFYCISYQLKTEDAIKQTVKTQSLTSFDMTIVPNIKLKRYFCKPK